MGPQLTLLQDRVRARLHEQRTFVVAFLGALAGSLLGHMLACAVVAKEDL